MSTRALRPCPTPGCPQLVQSGYCTLHTPTDSRPSAARRGYDRVWQALRAEVLLQEPACRECGSADAPEVHHIDGNPRNRQRSNLKRLCKPCHSRYTARTQMHRQPGWKQAQRKPAPFPVIA